MTAKKKGQIGVIAEFFGRQPGQSLSEFKAECDKLSVDEKLELAQGSARNLGLGQDQVSFPLS